MRIISYLLIGALLFLVLMGVFSLLRAFLSGMRGLRKVPYAGIVDPNPPAPVVRTGPQVFISSMAILWSLIHLAGSAVWLRWDDTYFDLLARLLVSGYAVAAALITGLGGLMLMKLQAYGRRIISYGLMLFGIMAFLGGAFMLLIKAYEQTAVKLGRIALPLSLALAGHVILDVAIGSAAQHVGRPRTTGKSQASDDPAWQTAGRKNSPASTDR